MKAAGAIPTGRTASGSSGGEAAALATGMSPIGLGNDIGGSRVVGVLRGLPDIVGPTWCEPQFAHGYDDAGAGSAATSSISCVSSPR